MYPFAASGEWYSRWIRSLIDGEESPFPIVPAKELARARIAGGMLLTAPVEGGARILRNHGGKEIRLSDHGRWRDVHLGAIRAAYGKTPYFFYLFPRLQQIYCEKGEGSLSDFTGALHDLAREWLGWNEEMAQSLQMMRARQPDRLRSLAEQYRSRCDLDLCIFDILFRYGKESIFAFL